MIIARLRIRIARIFVREVLVSESLTPDDIVIQSIELADYVFSTLRVGMKNSSSDWEVLGPLAIAPPLDSVTQ